MVDLRVKGYLEHIIRHCDDILSETENLTKEEYDLNKKHRDLICFYILQIGELVKQFEPDFVAKYSTVPWKKIAGMRDVIAHGYGHIKHNEVWDISHRNVPELKVYCEQILSDK